MLPDFLGIGSQRTASTWLYQVLRQHPGLYLPDTKEIHFFDWKILRHDLAWYERHFAPAAELPGKRLLGEITPSYCTLSRSSVENIRALLPQVRPFIVLRNPVERSWSAAMYELGVDAHRSFERVPVGEVLRHLERPRSRKRSDYLHGVTIWRAVFGESALHVSLFDDFKRDRNAFLASILQHIGADAGWTPAPAAVAREVNASQHFEMPEMIGWYLSRQWLEPTQRLNELLGGRVTPWVEEMRARSEGRISWRLLRALNRGLYAAPYLALYAPFAAWREQRFQSRWRALGART